MDTPFEPSGRQLASTAAPVCQVIDFESAGLEHGTLVNSIASGFGFDLTVTTVADPTGTGANQAVIFDTDDVTHPEDFDLRWQGPGALCPACQGLGNILVILDSRGFDIEGDAVGGGTIEFTGFSGNGTFFLNKFIAVDNDDDEAAISVTIDNAGAPYASSSGLGNGSVEVVEPATKPTFTSSLLFTFGGSGGIDGIEICRVPEKTGGEGCTLGYWKNEQHHDSWVPTGYSTSQKLNTVFDFTGPAAQFASIGNFTLLEALSFGGGPNLSDKVKLMLKQAVAAILSAAHPDVDYAFTTSEVITAVNNALDSGNATTIGNLQGQLDAANSAGCPLD